MNELKRILVVDDEPVVAGIIGEVFQTTGLYEVRVVTDPFNATEVGREFLPDIVVLDIVMPGMDGGEVLTSLRADPSMADVPVVFLTGLVSESEVGHIGGRTGDAPVVAKPVRPSVLRAVVADQLSRGEAVK